MSAAPPPPSCPVPPAFRHQVAEPRCSARFEDAGEDHSLDSWHPTCCPGAPRGPPPPGRGVSLAPWTPEGPQRRLFLSRALAPVGTRTGPREGGIWHPGGDSCLLDPGVSYTAARGPLGRTGHWRLSPVSRLPPLVPFQFPILAALLPCPTAASPPAGQPLSRTVRILQLHPLRPKADFPIPSPARWPPVPARQRHSFRLVPVGLAASLPVPFLLTRVLACLRL